MNDAILFIQVKFYAYRLDWVNVGRLMGGIRGSMVRAGGNGPAVWGVYILAFWMMLLTPLISSDDSANASEHAAVSVQTKSLLQASLTRYLSEASSSDGGFVYVDRKTAQRRTAYLSAQHPQIIPFFDDYYLCVTMISDTGMPMDVDFLMRPRAGLSSPLHPEDMLVVDVIIDNRKLLLNALHLSGLPLP